MKPRKKVTRSKPGKSTWEPEWPTDGVMQFLVEGYVQSVKEDDDVDYVTFKLDNPYVEGNINTMCVTVDHDEFDCPEPGDRLSIVGNIRSWWDREMERVRYEFVATSIEQAR